MKLWSGEDLIKHSGGNCKDSNFSATAISIDSRTLNKGDVFIAIKGDKFNGEKYLKQAQNKGASAVITTTPDKTVSIPQIIVEDALSSINALGKFARARLKGKVIAVSGSVGKTTTKDALKSILQNFGKTYATKGNLNNHLGLLLSLINAPKNVDYAIFELGMSAPKEILHLVKIAEPNIAIITNVSPAHLEFFKSTAHIARAKAEIFEFSKDSIAIFNLDTMHSDILANQAGKLSNKVLTFGTDKNATIQIKKVQTSSVGRLIQSVELAFNYDGKTQPIKFSTSSVGIHRVYNYCAALLAVFALEIDIEKASTYLKNITPSDARGNTIQCKIKDFKFTCIDETYNSSPASVKASLEVLSYTPASSRKIAVLGDMLELGEDSKSLHLKLKPLLEKYKIDKVYACGKNMQGLYKTLNKSCQGGSAENSSILLPLVLKDIQANDVIMIKGSLGSNMKIILDKLTG